jgi:hypothetical protein
VTDDRGAMIGEVLQWPFSRVSRELQTWPSDGLEHIWALCKLVACAIQDRPFVQFDYDVLLFKPLPDELCSARLLAQSVDFENYYKSPEMRAGLGIAGFRQGVTAYNAGIIGGSDVALVRAYAWAGLDLARKFWRHPLNGTTTSMLVEQYQLGVFSERVGVSVSTLLPTVPTRQQIADAGYAHLTGGSKHSRLWLSRVEARLAREFPHAYLRFCEAWPQLAAQESFGAGAPSSGSGESTPFATEF